MADKPRKGQYLTQNLEYVEIFNGQACNGMKVSYSKCAFIVAHRLLGPMVGGPYGPYQQVCHM